MDQVLARLAGTERARLAEYLDAASFAVWEARHTLSTERGAQLSAAEWRTYLRTAMDALGAADDLVTKCLLPAERER